MQVTEYVHSINDAVFLHAALQYGLRKGLVFFLPGRLSFLNLSLLFSAEMDIEIFESWGLLAHSTEILLFAS